MIKVSAEEGINWDRGHQGGLPGGGGACFRLPITYKGTWGYKQGVGRKQSTRQRKKGEGLGLLKELAWSECVGMGIDMGAWRGLENQVYAFRYHHAGDGRQWRVLFRRLLTEQFSARGEASGKWPWAKFLELMQTDNSPPHWQLHPAGALFAGLGAERRSGNRWCWGFNY